MQGLLPTVALSFYHSPLFTNFSPMKHLRIIGDVFAIIAIIGAMWTIYQLDRVNENLAGKVYRLKNQQSDCSTQLRACYMDIDAMEQLNADGK
jgi:hypothetical protein